MPNTPLDQKLLKIVQAAQNNPQNSQGRRRALGELVRVLRSSGKLTRPRRGQFKGFYNDIYEEALQRLFIHICEKIDAYNPERASVLSWVNFLLGQRFFIEASREFMATVYKGMDARTVKKVSVADLDREISSSRGAQTQPFLSDNVKDLSDNVKEYIQEDPDEVFQVTHVDGHPEASFQWIALQRLDGYAWREISGKLNIPIATLSSFYQRCIKRFASAIKRNLL